MAKSKQKRDWTLNISAKSLGELKKVTKLSRGHGVPRQTMYSWVSKCEKTDSSAFLGAWVCSWVRNKSFDGQSIFVSKEISRMSAKIKILFLVHSFSIGGVQKVNVSMINGIDKLFSPLIDLEKILLSATIQIRGKFHDKKRLYARIQRTDIKGMPRGRECCCCRQAA